MSRLARLVLVLAFLLALLPTSASAQSELPGNCKVTESNTGSLWLLCRPVGPPLGAPANGDLVVFAHGYVPPSPDLSLAFEQLTLPDGTFIPNMVTGLGYYFAASSYPKNGLAVREGLADTKAMVDALKTELSPGRVYLVGASEGGLVTTLGVERYPGTFSGGLSTCGPIGDFRGQINYFGDFRVIFDYFFPDVLPASPVSIPPELMASWYSEYAGQTGRIAGALAGNPIAAQQLFRVTRAAVDPGNPATAFFTARDVLWYNVFSTNEAKVELGGQPYGNRTRFYFGSTDDRLLNRLVQRFTASPTALKSIAAYYQTSGRLQKPLVTMHTTGDPVVPYWHEPLYTAKTLLTGSAKMHVNIPITRYGHCAFTAGETLAAFGILVQKVTGQLPPTSSVQAALPNAASRAEYADLVKRMATAK